MTTQPLFYQSVVPLNRESHRAFGIQTPMPFDFASASYLIPAVIDEFAAACASLAILFASDQDGISPVFLTGGAPGRNAFVSREGKWSGTYLPAYLRRYPFIRGDVSGGDPLICFDAQSGLVRATGDDGTLTLLFDQNGADTPALAERIKLTIDYADSAHRTQTFCKSLQDHKLLQPITIQTKTDATMSAVHGLMAVSEEALNGLSDDAFLALRKSGALAPIYMHLVSLRAIERLPASPV